jgi:serine protease Do
MRSVVVGVMVAVAAASAQAADWSQVHTSVGPAVLRVAIGDGNREGSCSGVVVNADAGYVLTAAHCIQTEGEFNYTVAGRHADVVRYNRVLDLAVLSVKLPKGTPQVKVAVVAPKTGAAVAVVGYGFGSAELAIQSGIVANARETASERMLVDANLLPGDSGGAIVNEAGELVGITSAFQFMLAAHQGLAIPLDTLRPFVEEYLPAVKK